MNDYASVEVEWLEIKRLLEGTSSTAFKPDSPHDFMHNKLLVTDSAVPTGSFNLSRTAESNAQNVLSIPDGELVSANKTYVETLIKKYGG